MLRIVIADDYSDPLMFARRVLHEAGHMIVGLARDGRAAVNMCEEHHPDLVILDIGMPILSGADAARQIIQRKLARHVCMASSNSQEAVYKPLLDIGCDFITKPYKPDRLLKAVAKYEPATLAELRGETESAAADAST